MKKQTILREGVRITAAIVCASAFCIAENTPVSLTHHGSSAFCVGQIVRGSLHGGEITHSWRESMTLRYGFDARIDERSRIVADVDINIIFSYHTNLYSEFKVSDPQHRLRLHRAEGIYSFGDPLDPVLTAGVGYFPFKYNPQARHLGEYLFRSEAYPTVLRSDFDKPLKHLLGVRLDNTLFGILHHTLLLTSEESMVPYYDFSLSYVGDVKIGRMVRIGAGVSFQYLLSVNNLATTPRDSRTQIIDTLGAGAAFDTSYLSFRNERVMSRITLDPKPLLGSLGAMMGKDELLVYGEAAILGLRNQKLYYTNLSERLPTMAGLTLPTFKIIDIIALEFEYNPNRFDNNFFMRSAHNLPLPMPNTSQALIEVTYRKSPFFWSVYGKKRFNSSFSITGQLGRGHEFMVTESFVNRDYNELMAGKSHWGWNLKAAFEF